MSLNPATLQLLSAYVDGELTPAERETVERALAADPRVREIERSMRGLGSAVRALSEAEVAKADFAGLTDRVMARVSRRPGVLARLRVKKLTALLRLALALLRSSGFTLTHERLPDGRAKIRILRAVDRAREFVPLRTLLRFLRLSPSRFHAWRLQHACALDDQSSCPHTSPLPRQYCSRPKSLTLASPVGILRGDASRHQDGCCGRIGSGNASKPPVRDACPAPPTRRPRVRISAFAQLTGCFGCFCTGSGPGGGKRWRSLSQPLSIGGIAEAYVEAAAAARDARKTTHRFALSRSDSAYGRGELSLGRSADPRRIAEARHHHFGTHRLAVFTRPPDEPVTNLAHILRQPLRWPDIYLAGDVRGCARCRHSRRRV